MKNVGLTWRYMKDEFPHQKLSYSKNFLLMTFEQSLFCWFEQKTVCPQKCGFYQPFPFIFRDSYFMKHFRAICCHDWRTEISWIPPKVFWQEHHLWESHNFHPVLGQSATVQMEVMGIDPWCMETCKNISKAQPEYSALRSYGDFLVFCFPTALKCRN